MLPPRFSQHFDLLNDEPPWTIEGSRKAWSERSCGLACLRSIIGFHSLPIPSQTRLIEDALAIKAFSPQGMVHRKLGVLAQLHGLSAEAAEVADACRLFDLAADGYPPIASVTHQLPQDGRRGGHLVVAAGWASGRAARPASAADAGSEPCAAASSAVPPTGEREVLFVDPSRWGAHHHRVTLDRFAASYSHRCLILWPATEGRPRGLAAMFGVSADGRL